MNYLSWMNIKVKNPKITFLLTFITKQKKPLLNSNARPVKFNRNGRIITKNTIRRIRKKHNCRTQTIVKMYFTFTGDLRAHVVFSYVYDYTRASLVRNVGHFVPNRFTKQSSCRAKVLSFQSIFTPLSRVRRRWYSSSAARYYRKMIFRICPTVSLIVSISFQGVQIRDRYNSPNNRLILLLFSRRVSIFFFYNFFPS